MQEIMKLTALQLGAAIRRGEVSPTEAVKAALERIEESIGQSVTTVATGGNAPRILRYCKRPIQYDADLIMTGLYLLYQKNAKKYRKA